MDELESAKSHIHFTIRNVSIPSELILMNVDSLLVVSYLKAFPIKFLILI